MTTELARPWMARYKQWWHSNRGWLWDAVLTPLLATRLMLLLVAWLAQMFPASPDYPIQKAVQRGWNFSPYGWIDIWGRWDTGWYMSIVQGGYRVGSDFLTAQSNIAFFPLYPYTVRVLLLLVPQSLQTPGVILLAGVILSNLLLLGALIVLYRLVASMFDDATARRAIWYLVLFPSGFFLSAFYTEAAFLFLTVASLCAASRKAWGGAALLGGLAALTRPPGILIILPLLWMYAESIQWKPVRIGRTALWFLLVPLALLAHLAYIGSLTGDWLAVYKVQANWNRVLNLWPWPMLLKPPDFNAPVAVVEQLLMLGALLLVVAAWWRLPSKAYAIFVLAQIAPVLLGGTLSASPRYMLVWFPLFIVLAQMGKHPLVDRLVTATFLALQVVFMILWTRFYWVA